MANRRKRVFGDKINFKSLSCAPVNELGVVYLFGVLHDTFDLKIESIQAGFPDCIARRKIKHNRWEEVRIEFEFESRSFEVHRHDPSREVHARNNGDAIRIESKGGLHLFRQRRLGIRRESSIEGHGHGIFNRC